MNRHEADPFLQGYIDAALFTTDPQPPSGVDYVESGRADELYPALPASFIEQARKDCAKFQEENKLVLDGYPASRAGSDFWYTRNGHGVGFWENDFGSETQCEALTNAAHEFGEVHDFCAEDFGLVTKE